MTYSSYFPSDWRAYYVYLVERSMARRYPTGQVSHLIGLVGGGFPWGWWWILWAILSGLIAMKR